MEAIQKTATRGLGTKVKKKEKKKLRPPSAYLLFFRISDLSDLSDLSNSPPCVVRGCPQTFSPSSAKAQNVLRSSEKAQSMSLMSPERSRAVN